MTTNGDLLGRYGHALLGVFGTPALVVDRGEGCYVWDVDGKRYLDLLAGIAVNALGHNHPELVAAVSKQVGEVVREGLAGLDVAHCHHDRAAAHAAVGLARVVDEVGRFGLGCAREIEELLDLDAARPLTVGKRRSRAGCGRWKRFTNWRCGTS